MVSVNYWVEHQGSRSSVPHTSRVVPVIEGDRGDRPVVKFGDHGLYSICVSERVFTPSRGYVSRMDHVYYFYLRWEFFLSPGVRLARLILVFTWCLPPLVFGVLVCWPA